jgi:hypothetical protein
MPLPDRAIGHPEEAVLNGIGLKPVVLAALTRKLGPGGRAAANLDVNGGKVAAKASVVRREDRVAGIGCGSRAAGQGVGLNAGC